MGGEASSGHSLQGIGLGSGDPEGLQHVQIVFSRLPCGHRPVEAMEEACQPKLHHDQPHGQAGADPAPGSERKQLVACAFHVDVAADESVRVELQWVLVDRWVPVHRPDVDEHTRVFGDVVTGDCRILGGDMGHHQGAWGVQPKRFFDDTLDVLQLRHVGFLEGTFPTDHPVELLVCLPQHFGVF